MKGNHYPIRALRHHSLMPDVSRNRNPAPFKWRVRLTHQKIGLPLTFAAVRQFGSNLQILQLLRTTSSVDDCSDGVLLL